MAPYRLESVLHHLRRKIVGSAGPALNDGQLLDRFARHGDTAAFELLVRRHGPLVWSVCRRILGNAADADDAFQAVFVVLLRKAASLDGSGTVAPWLAGVAYRVSLRARAQRHRRRDHEQQVPPREVSGSDPEASELRALLDAELQELPEKYRAVLVLCDLQGKTHAEAAQELRWPLGTLKCRVRRGRAQLRARLARRGFVLSAAAMGALLTKEAAQAQVPAVLVDATVRAALSYAAGQPVAAAVTGLADGVLRGMFQTQLKIAAVLALVFVALSGIGILTYPSAAGELPAPAAPVEQVAAAETPGETVHPLAAAWDDLASEDDARALTAVLLFARDPKATLPFFKDHVQPVLVDAKRVVQLVADLESDKFPVRDKATRELEAAGEYAIPYLQAALDAKPALEPRKRIEGLLVRLKSPASPRPWVRTARALAVLEHIGSAEARAIVAAVAKGRSRAWPTQVAEATLDRLDVKPTVPLERHWDDLAAKDESHAARALLGLRATPKETIAFLKEWAENRGKNTTGADAKRIAELIADLDSEQFAVRQKASQQLEDLGDEAVPALARAWKAASPEVRQRIDGLLQNVLRKALRDGGPAVLRLKRAALLLETLDTRESRELLAVLKEKALLNQGAREAVSPDGKLRAAAAEGGQVRVTEVASGKEVLSLKGKLPPITLVVFAPDGHTLAAASSTGQVFAWDMPSGALRWYSEGQDGVEALRYSADSKTLTRIGVRSAYIWDAVTGKMLVQERP